MHSQTPSPDAAPIDPGSRAALLPAAGLNASEWNFSIGAGAGRFEKLRAMPVKLGGIDRLVYELYDLTAQEISIVEAGS